LRCAIFQHVLCETVAMGIQRQQLLTALGSNRAVGASVLVLTHIHVTWLCACLLPLRTLDVVPAARLPVRSRCVHKGVGQCSLLTLVVIRVLLATWHDRTDRQRTPNARLGFAWPAPLAPCSWFAALYIASLAFMRTYTTYYKSWCDTNCRKVICSM
jgi:hypothetical protein